MNMFTILSFFWWLLTIGSVESSTCDWGSPSNDGRPYMRDECQMVETIGMVRQYFKFYCDTKKMVGIMGYYHKNDETCSDTPTVSEQAYAYQCTWNSSYTTHVFDNNNNNNNKNQINKFSKNGMTATETATATADCTPFYISYSNYYSTTECEGTIAQNFSLILTPLNGCRDIGGGASSNYTFNSNPSEMIIQTWATSDSCDSSVATETETYIQGCHKLTNRINDGYSQINIDYNNTQN